MNFCTKISYSKCLEPRSGKLENMKINQGNDYLIFLFFFCSNLNPIISIFQKRDRYRIDLFNTLI